MTKVLEFSEIDDLFFKYKEASNQENTEEYLDRLKNDIICALWNNLKTKKWIAGVLSENADAMVKTTTYCIKKYVEYENHQGFSAYTTKSIKNKLMNNSIEKFIITTEKKKKEQNFLQISDIILEGETQKKSLVSATVNFVTPLHEDSAAKLIGKKIKPPKKSYKTQNSSVIKCPYCTNYNKKEEESLILHIYNQHSQNAKADGYIKFLGSIIKCAHCKELITDCPDTEIMKHLNKQCELKETPKQIVGWKKNRVKSTSIVSKKISLSNELGICASCCNNKNGNCIRGRPLGNGTSVCLYFDK